MEFGEKIQKLRNEKKWTQEQLAEKLYVSRTAVSKWESGKGYPNIDSLKDIAKKENTTNIKRTNNLIYGLLDIISILFIFLPLYAQKTESFVYSVSLISTNDISNIIKISYIVILSILSLIGIFEFIMNFIDNKKNQRIVNIISLIVESISILFFAMSRQTYLTAIIFIILIIKITVIIKNISNKKDVL